MPPHAQYREADKRHITKTSNGPQPKPEPYRLSFVSSIARRSSDLFFITFFSRNPGEEAVMVAMVNTFGDSLHKVVKVGPVFYEVQLKEAQSWGKIKELVSRTLEELTE